MKHDNGLSFEPFKKCGEMGTTVNLFGAERGPRNCKLENEWSN